MSQALEWLRLGGPLMIVLLALSILAVTLIVFKLWEFRSLQITRRGFVPAVLEAQRAGQTDQALVMLTASPSPLAELMAATLKSLRNPHLSDAQRREYLENLAANRLEDLRGLFRPLEVISTVAPLLGLLGTVIGMIEAFQQLQAVGDRVDASVLSGGIWQALLTTAAGLSIAIPVVAVLNYFERLVERLHRDIESGITELLLMAPPAHSPAHSPVSAQVRDAARAR